VYDTPCPNCGGTGLCSVCDGSGECYACDGQGGKICWQCDGTGREGRCPHCGGTGEIECPNCDGKGVITTPQGIAVSKYNEVNRVLPNGEEEPLTLTEITDEFKVVSYENSHVEYYIVDYAIIKQGENTLFEFKEVRLTDGNLLSLLHWGKIQVDVWIGGMHHTYYTPNALIELFETEFTLEVTEDGTTTLTVLNGTVEFTDRTLNESVQVSRYQTSVIVPGGTPSSPTSIDPVEIDRWWEWEVTEKLLLPAPLATAIIVIMIIGKRPKSGFALYPMC
jgi:hypothetical protein